MDELELLKRKWQNQNQDLPRLTFDEIYRMLLKKSSSIVKLILFISIAEIIFWTCLAFLVPESSQKFTKDLGLNQVMWIANIVYYTVCILFIFIFYQNYRNISTTDSVKDLMRNIIRTRKTVKYFIIYNIVSMITMLAAINVFYYAHQDLVFELMVKDYGVLSTMDKHQFISIFLWTQVIIGVVVIALILLFYRLVYGILLRRLKKNYKELEKIES